MTKAEKFCKLNGIGWNENQYRNEGDNPTFTDAKSILEVMMKRGDDYYSFLRLLINEHHLAPTADFIDNYILNPDKLLTEAIEWCEVHLPEPELLGLGMSGEQMFKQKGEVK